MEWIGELTVYLASALMALLAGWLLWGVYKKKYQELYLEASRDKTTLNKLIGDFKNFKSESEEALDKKNQEIRKWKRLSETISMTNEDSAPKAEVEKWKKRCKSIEAELAVTQVNFTSKNHLKEINKLQTDLDGAKLKIKKQDILLLKAKRESFPTNDSVQIKTLKKKIKQLSQTNKTGNKKIGEAESSQLKKQNKKLRKRLKKLKKIIGKKPAIQETIEITQSLDIQKLTNLLTNGSLMVSKRKVLKSSKK